MHRLAAIVDERGLEDAELEGGAHRLRALVLVELAILAVVVLAMTTKLSASSSTFWAAAAILAGAGWSALRAYRGTAATESPELAA